MKEMKKILSYKHFVKVIEYLPKNILDNLIFTKYDIYEFEKCPYRFFVIA